MTITKTVITKSQVTVYSVEDLITLLKNAVEDRGAEYTYQSAFGDETCENFSPEGDPKCIIGYVFYSIGVRLGECTTSVGIEAAVGELRNSRPDLVFTDEFIFIGLLAQRMQDKGLTWGDVYTIAEQMQYSVSAHGPWKVTHNTPTYQHEYENY